MFSCTLVQTIFVVPDLLVVLTPGSHKNFTRWDMSPPPLHDFPLYCATHGTRENSSTYPDNEKFPPVLKIFSAIFSHFEIYWRGFAF
jgi:hypothetical protein